MCTCFFFNDTATTEIYTLSLHDALPISTLSEKVDAVQQGLFNDLYALMYVDGKPKATMTQEEINKAKALVVSLDRKSTRLNSSHANISYAVFCLKKKHSLLLAIYNIQLH